MTAPNLLSSIAGVSTDTEFYTPMPAGYKPGKTKYVGVFGTVMSGLGKGIFASSLAKTLKDKGLTVAPIKLEGYLNLDSGTLNPYRHGEVFVLDDGMECDMDLGTYERMLDQNMTRRNFTTSGQVFTVVLEKERRGGYLGRDVQMIPHVTGEVKSRLRELAVASDADVVFIEIGGTVGDVENAYYIEAVRELAFEEGPQSACFVALTYVLEPASLGEQKSKAAQLGIKKLIECGIQPHIIACRARHPVNHQVREKIALYSSVPFERMFSMHDCDSIYMMPEMLREAGLDQAVVDILGLGHRVHAEAEAKAIEVWKDYLAAWRSAQDAVTIGIVGKYTSVRDSYASVIKALEHGGTRCGVRVDIDWIEAGDLAGAQSPSAVGSVAQPPSAVGSVAQPPSTVGSVAQPPSAVGSVAQPPLAVGSVAQPPSTVGSVAQPPSAVGSVAQPPSAVGSVAQPPSTVGSVAQPPSTVGSVAQPPSAVDVAERLRRLHGLIVPGGFGIRGIEGKIACVQYARTTGLPYLGLCLGFQMAVVEYARNVCGLGDASTTEIEPDCRHAVIDILPEQKQIEGLGGNMRLGGRDVVLKPGSLAARLYNGAPEIRLRFRHRYEVDPRYIDQLETGGLVFSGRAPDFPIMQVLELPTEVHPYFIATQAHPELTSRPLRPDPFFLGLVRAAVERRGTHPPARSRVAADPRVGRCKG